MIDTVRAWALSMVGTGYVYGATGWVCSKARREQQAAQYPEYASTILGTCAKWDGKICHDCAQLTRKALAQIGITLPSGATSQWKADVWAEKGTIDSVPKDKYCHLFRESDGKMQHTLIYLGDGRVVDARGSSQGVMLTQLGDYKATHWAIPRGVHDNTGGDKDMPTIRTAIVTKIAGATGSTVRLRAQPDGKELTTISFGTVVSIIEEKDGWSRFKHGIYDGWMQSKYLLDAEDASDAPSPPVVDDGDSITLTLPRAQAQGLYDALGTILGKG